MQRIGRLRYLEVPASGNVPEAGTLVLVHGFPLNPSMWEPQHPLAELGWRLIIPELRGFGDGAGDPPASTLEDYSDDTMDLLDALHIDYSALCGLSMGGYVAMGMFRRGPSYFGAVVLADTRAEGDPPEAAAGRKSMQQLAREKGPAAIADALLPKLVCDATRASRPDVVESLRRQITGNSVESITGALDVLMTRPDSTPTLATMLIPTLVVVGSEDVITPPALSEKMRQGLEDSELVIIPGAGHMSNMEQPDAFNDAVGRFLTKFA